MGADHYVKEAIRNVERFLEKYDRQLKTKAPTTLPTGHVPELDATKELDDEMASMHQQCIGVLRWAVELGRVDICGEVSMMAGFSANPRVGHFEAIMHMFAHLKHHKRSKVVLDSSYPVLPEVVERNWESFYGKIEEEKPPDAPNPLGQPVDMVTFVDANHAGNKVNRRSRTGVLMCLSKALVGWYSKKQGSVETSTFGSEMVAMKTAIELSLGLRYKLRMMGVPLEGPIHIKGDNMSVISDASIPASVLKKKSQSIAHHFIREQSARGVIYVSHEPTETNLSDLLTKIMNAPTKDGLVKRVLF